MDSLASNSNRRSFLKKSALAAAATVLPTALARPAYAVCGGTTSTTKHFDFTQPSITLYEDKPMHDTSTGPQSMCFSNGQNRMFYLETRNASNGDLTLSYNYTSTGGLNTGNYYMNLRGFGHGQSLGIEYIGTDTWIWMECDAPPVASGDTFGTKICRFKFNWTPMTVLYSSDLGTPAAPVSTASPGSMTYTLKPGSTYNGCAIDTTSNRLLLRYKLAGDVRYALYSLSDVKSLGDSAIACTDQLQDPLQPSDDGTLGPFQGFTLYGDYAHGISGKGKSDCESATAQKTWLYYQNVAVIGGGSGHALTSAGYTLPRREPEGMAIQITDSGPRLVFGFNNTAHGTCSSPYYGSFFYKSDLIS